MKTPITYYGGKQSLSERIVSIFPFHKIYCEPFFGGGAVFFKKPKSYLEVINDVDNRLMNFYQVTQTHFEQLKYLIDHTLNSEVQYLHAKDIWNDRLPSTDIEKAWAVWLITNGSFGASMHGGCRWSNGTSGSHTGLFLENKRNHFSLAIHKRLQNVQISSRDGLKVIEERDTKDTLFYLDPPYPGAYQAHYTGYSFKDLAMLLEVLGQITGKFILSNYWSQTLKFYINKNKWQFHSIETNTKVSNFNTKPTRRLEFLVYNFNNCNDLFNSHHNESHHH